MYSAESQKLQCTVSCLLPGAMDTKSQWLATCCSGYRSSSMNEVDARRARLQLGWVTVFGQVYHLGL